MLPVRLLALIVVLFFSIALVPGLIKVPERTRRDTPQPMAIAKIPDRPNVPDAVDRNAEHVSKREQQGADLANLLAKQGSEPATIIPAKHAETPTAPEIAEEATPKLQPPTRDRAVSFKAPEEPGPDVVAHETERYDLTGSVQPSAPAAGIAVANRAIENPVALPPTRPVQKPPVRKGLRHVARPKAPISPGWPPALPSANAARANAYAWKPAELPTPNFTNSGY